jgi:polysaccharide export outer membrane protein
MVVRWSRVMVLWVIVLAGCADWTLPPPAADANGPYVLDSGDKLRILVFGQEALSNSYAVDAAGKITMPLIGAVGARGISTQALSQVIAAHLRQGYVREPHVAVEVETYRPFFVLGEITTPGQFAFVPGMTVENAVAIAGGFTPRANRHQVELHRLIHGQVMRATVPLDYWAPRRHDSGLRTLALGPCRDRAGRSKYCMSCAHPSAACSATWLISPAVKWRAATKWASSSTR